MALKMSLKIQAQEDLITFRQVSRTEVSQDFPFWGFRIHVVNSMTVLQPEF